MVLVSYELEFEIGAQTRIAG